MNLILLEKSQTCDYWYTACYCNIGAKVAVSKDSVGTLRQAVEVSGHYHSHDHSNNIIFFQ